MAAHGVEHRFVAHGELFRGDERRHFAVQQAGCALLVLVHLPPVALGQGEQFVVGAFLGAVVEQGGQLGLGGVDAEPLGQGHRCFPHAQYVLEAGGGQVFTQVRLDAGDLVGVVCHGGKAALAWPSAGGSKP